MHKARNDFKKVLTFSLGDGKPTAYKVLAMVTMNSVPIFPADCVAQYATEHHVLSFEQAVNSG